MVDYRKFNIILGSIFLFTMMAWIDAQADRGGGHFNRGGAGGFSRGAPGGAVRSNVQPQFRYNAPRNINPSAGVMMRNTPQSQGIPGSVSVPNQGIPGAVVPVRQQQFNQQQFHHQQQFRHDHHQGKRYYQNQFYGAPIAYPYYYYNYPYTYPNTYYYTNPSYDNSYVNTNVYQNAPADQTYSTTVTTTTENMPVRSAIPVISISNVPKGSWVWGRDGSVPDNAIVYGYLNQNNAPVYYCKVQFNEIYHVGMLVQNDACYINNNGSTVRYTYYQTLIPY